MKHLSTNFRPLLHNLLITLGLCLTGILIGELLVHYGAPEESIVCLYLLADVLVSAFTPGYFWGICAAILCSVAYSFFVKAPVMSFAEMSPYSLLTMGLMAFISILTCSITSTVRKQEVLAHEREKQSLALYHLTRDLASCTSLNAALRTALWNIQEQFETNCRILLFTPEGLPEKTFTLLQDDKIHPKQPTDKTRDFSEYKTRPQSGYWIHETSPRQFEWPFYKPDGRVLGAVAIPFDTAAKFSESQLQMVSTMVDAIGIVIDKMRIVQGREKVRMEVSQERYRNNLLRSVSHDLRTPLAGISGTAEVLMQTLPEESEEWKMARSIRKETNWLYTMVQNILYLTRLQNGNVEIRKELNVVEDVVHAAIEMMRLRLPERELSESDPDDILLAPMDATLITQVVINLIDNANKYSNPGTPIDVKIVDEGDNGMAAIHVLDHGEGLDPENKEKIFEMFYTTKSTTPGANRGYGLGLPICDSIVQAHGGTISADNRSDGQKGAEFIIRLPKGSLSDLSA